MLIGTCSNVDELRLEFSMPIIPFNGQIEYLFKTSSNVPISCDLLPKLLWASASLGLQRYCLSIADLPLTEQSTLAPLGVKNPAT